MSARLSVAVLVSAAVLSASSNAAEVYNYTAKLRAASRVEGPVAASGISWFCKGTVCTTKGPWPAPGVGACAALAQQVGEIVAYGHPGKQLPAGELATCNKGVSSTAAAPKVQLPAVFQPKPPAPSPETTSEAAAPAEFTPKSVRTATLAITGTGSRGGAVAAAFTPKSVRASTLTITGTGSRTPAATGPSFTPKTVRTGALTITGTGAR